MRGIDSDLQKQKVYNQKLRDMSKKHYGADLRSAIINRGSLFEENDEWMSKAKHRITPAPFSKEVTLFSF